MTRQEMTTRYNQDALHYAHAGNLDMATACLELALLVANEDHKALKDVEITALCVTIASMNQS